MALDNGFSAEGLDYSPIKGPEGNIEYLILIKKVKDDIIDEEKAKEFLDYNYSGNLSEYYDLIDKKVKESHEEHNI